MYKVRISPRKKIKLDFDLINNLWVALNTIHTLNIHCILIFYLDFHIQNCQRTQKMYSIVNLKFGWMKREMAREQNHFQTILHCNCMQYNVSRGLIGKCVGIGCTWLSAVVILFVVFLLMMSPGVGPFLVLHAVKCQMILLENVTYVDSTNELLGSTVRPIDRPFARPSAEGNGDFEYGSISFMHDFFLTITMILWLFSFGFYFSSIFAENFNFAFNFNSDVLINVNLTLSQTHL